MKHKAVSAVLAALLLAGALPVSACAAETEDGFTYALNREEHVPYISGYSDGTFRPDAPVTRAEVCKMLDTLLTARAGASDAGFSDVPAGRWYAAPIAEMKQAGWIGGYADGTFRPDASITRAEFVTILSRMPHDSIGTDRTFRDVPASHWAHDAVQTALAQGWTGGYSDGTFRPDATITRAETATMLGRLLGRQGDAVMAATGDGIRIMPDVPDTHWAYLAMLEATTGHQYEKTDGIERWTDFDRETTVLAEGWHNIGGELFHVNAGQQFDSSKTVGGLTLDRNGRYTTGSAELDRLLTAAAAEAVQSGMTQDERLRAVYDYAKARFGYLGIGTVDTAVPGWDVEQALNMLQNGRGNCYSWSAVFTHLARKVGYDAKAVAGTGISPKGNESVHAWTEITIDGTPYTFDPQIESVYAARYNEHYDLYRKRYGEAAWGYRADAAQEPEPPQEPEADAALVSLMEQVYGDAQAQEAMLQTVLYKGMGADGMGAVLSYYLGSNDLDIEAGLASEPMLNVHPHSVVLARFAEGTDMDAVKKAVAAGADPYKWVCVGVDPKNVRVETAGQLLLLVMDNDRPDVYVSNFRQAVR